MWAGEDLGFNVLRLCLFFHLFPFFFPLLTHVLLPPKHFSFPLISLRSETSGFLWLLYSYNFPVLMGLAWVVVAFLLSVISRSVKPLRTILLFKSWEGWGGI